MPGSDKASLQLATLIVDLARDLTRHTPAPGTAPFFGLDHDQPYDLKVLEQLSSPGIFRKYELVLYLHSGLGGAARWLASRLGCRILGADRDLGRVRAAQRLSRQAHMSDRVSFVATAPEALGFRDCQFTHVWIVDPPPPYRSPAALREARRVLRRGGQFALHAIADDLPESARLCEQIRKAGFSDVTIQRVLLAAPDHLLAAARSRMRQRLQGHPDLRHAWSDHGPGTGASCVQIFGRRE